MEPPAVGSLSPVPRSFDPIGQHVTIGRYITSEAVRLGVSGLCAGLVVGFVCRAAGRIRWGATPFLVAVLAAAGLTGRSDWPRWSETAAACAVVLMLGGAGAARFLASPTTHWAWVASAALVSTAGVWVGVPETGPALLTAGGLAGLMAAAALTGACWAPAAGVGVAAVLGWAALSGAAGRPWAAVGGALCVGVAPWFALRPPYAAALSGAGSPRPRWWLLLAHMALVILAARWIGVDPDAGWGRVAFLAVAGGVVAVASGRASA